MTTRATAPGTALSRTSGPAAVCNAIGYAEEEDGGQLRALFCRTGQLAVSLGSDPQALDASHAAAGILAPDVRGHLYGRNAAGAWEALLCEAQPGTYTARAFGAGALSTCSEMFASDGSAIRPVLMASNSGSLNVFPYVTRTDGNSAGLQCSMHGRLYTLPGIPFASDTVGEPTKVSGVYAAVAGMGHVAKASAGWLLGVDVTNEGAAGYLQVHNTTAVPAASRVPEVCWPVPIGSTTPREFIRSRNQLADGFRWGTGITLAWSSTRDIYTAANFTGTVTTYVS